MSQHRREARVKLFRKPRTRRGRIVGGLVGFLVALTAAATAAALFFAHAGVGGSVQGANFSALWLQDSSGHDPTAVQTGGGTCTVSPITNGRITLTIANAYPGASCLVDGYIGLPANAAEAGKVTGLDLTLPSGWTSALTLGCGASVPVNTTQATEVHVRFTITMGQTAALGSGGTLGVGDGIAVAPASESAPLGAGCV